MKVVIATYGDINDTQEADTDKCGKDNNRIQVKWSRY